MLLSYSSAGGEMCNVLRRRRFVQNLWPLFCKHFKVPKSSKDIFKVTKKEKMQYLKKAFWVVLTFKNSHSSIFKFRMMHYFLNYFFSCVSIFRGSSIDGGGTMRAGTQTLIPIITFLVLSIGLVIILAVLLWKTRSALNVATQKINQNHEAQQLTTATTWFDSNVFLISDLLQ